MNARISSLAQRVLAADTYPALVPEKCADESDLRDPLAIARGIRRYLLKQPVEIRPDELLVDRYRAGACEYPADYYRCDGHKSKNAYWNTCCCNSLSNEVYYWGWTHVSFDYGYALQNGTQAYIRRIDAALARYAGDEAKTRFLLGMRVCVIAVQERMELIARAAEKEAERGAQHKAQFLAIAKNARRVPMRHAETFYEAVQAVWTLFLIAPDGLGRIDQYLYPYYEREIQADTLTRAQALELIEELFIKVHEAQVNNRALPISGHNHLVVGGRLQNGEDGFNALSELILEAIAELPTYRPQASFRYTHKTSAETMRKITALNRRCPLIVFVNDEPRIKGMVNCGIRMEDAIEYTVLGCNEWAICGKSELDLAHASMLHPLKSALFERSAEACAAQDFNAFYRLFEECLSEDINYIADGYVAYAEAKRGDINVLTSAFMDDCIVNARPFNNGGARYHGLTISFNGFTNAADSLSVIREYVFDKRRLSMRELIEILEADWAGAEALRGEILKSGRFFGNDDEYADDIARRIADSVESIRASVKRDDINLLVCGAFVGATHPNIVFGRLTPATPDGRRAGEAFTMGVSQTSGRDRNGMTALLKSIAKIDYSKLCGCLVSNIRMDPRMADTPEKLDKISQLFHAFLRMGGMQLQINYISASELKRAQSRPDEYANLMVRVTGYSGFFTLFDDALQNDIINRTEYAHV